MARVAIRGAVVRFFKSPSSALNRAMVNMAFFASRGKISIGFCYCAPSRLRKLRAPTDEYVFEDWIINHALSASTMRCVMDAGFVANEPLMGL